AEPEAAARVVGGAGVEVVARIVVGDHEAPHHGRAEVVRAGIEVVAGVLNAGLTDSPGALVEDRAGVAVLARCGVVDGPAHEGAAERAARVVGAGVTVVALEAAGGAAARGDRAVGGALVAELAGLAHAVAADPDREGAHVLLEAEERAAAG